MALNGTLLAQAICSQLGVTDAKAAADLTTIVTQIILHIQTNGVVTGTATVTSAPGTAPVIGKIT